MGWAKYYEVNMSIYIGRMEVRKVSPVFYERHETVKAPVVKTAATEEKKKNIEAEKTEQTRTSMGRKGLKVVFQNGADEGMIRKMQMNGWWWSKANACWFNKDTNGNRRYAKSLSVVGAKVSVML